MLDREHQQLVNPLQAALGNTGKTKRNLHQKQVQGGAGIRLGGAGIRLGGQESGWGFRGKKREKRRAKHTLWERDSTII